MASKADAGRVGRPAPDDEQQRAWLTRHRRGDEAAFAELLAAYQRPVYSYLVRCGVAEPSRDDVFQDIFLKIHAAADAYRPERPLRPWIFAIAANTVRNHFRGCRGHLPWDETALAVPHPQADLDRTLDSRAELAWLEQAITALPLAQREVLNLTAIEGFLLQETAAILDRPLNTVKTHLRRARQTLATALARRAGQTGGCDDAL